MTVLQVKEFYEKLANMQNEEKNLRHEMANKLQNITLNMEQKYKEIQNSNDPDFANQVLAHFGIKPKVDSRVSVFIGGGDKTLSINPQVNTNFQDGGEPEIEAMGVSWFVSGL